MFIKFCLLFYLILTSFFQWNPQFNLSTEVSHTPLDITCGILFQSVHKLPPTASKCQILGIVEIQGIKGFLNGELSKQNIKEQTLRLKVLMKPLSKYIYSKEK